MCVCVCGRKTENEEEDRPDNTKEKKEDRRLKIAMLSACVSERERRGKKDRGLEKECG